ncbi:hypothetical protein [uncultured Desulfosarcina sp.]|uniref:hypothetical protein n=1 Tax=uncultured Desulfosarcina sp. TaxID=218289 RepID=UPI0029C89380|nr:hypothetical protein [uncultured Desulfosarcina sp.]
MSKIFHPLPGWTKKKAGIPLWIAIITAISSDSTFNILKDLNNYCHRWELTDFPPIDDWLDFYEREAIETEWIFDFLGEEIKKPAVLNLGIVFLRYVKRRERNLRENANVLAPWVIEKDIVQFCDWLHEVDLDEFEAAISELPERGLNKYNKSPEAIFLIRVWLPCYFYYGDIPHNLFRKAVKGDFQSLCKLLRIDKAVLRDKRIAGIFQRFSLDTESTQFKEIHRAIGTPIKKVSKKKIKEIAAAIISTGTEAYGQPLTAPEIQSLFDHWAKFKDTTTLQDIDLPSPEAFAKQIQRIAPIYKKLFKLDKK